MRFAKPILTVVSALCMLMLVLCATSTAHAQMVNAQTGTTYTFKNADCDPQGLKIVTFSNASSVAVTLPQAGASNQFLGGCIIESQNLGVGTVTITPTTSTINSASTLLLTTGQSARIANDSFGSSTGNYWALQGVSCASGCNTTGPISVNGTAINWSAQGGVASVVSNGTGNAVGDLLTLNDGCATHTVVAISQVTTGVLTQVGVANPGLCAVPPVGTLSVLSTTGTGTGAQFTLAYTVNNGPIATGGSLFLNNGNFVFSYYSGTGYLGLSGTENSFFGYNAGGAFTGAASFNTADGHNACGIGGGTTGAGSGNTCLGADSQRNMNGGSAAMTSLGANAFKYQSYQTANGLAVGENAGLNLNINLGQIHSALVGPNACQGAVSTAAFHDATCLGDKTGSALTTASNFALIGENTGNATFASGTDVFLAGTGATAIDTPAANTNHYTNINQVIIANTAAPTISSGFGSGTPTITGSTSATFKLTVGTGGVATSGVVSFANAAPTTGYACDVTDTSSPALHIINALTSTSTSTWTSYNSTGSATAFGAGDVLIAKCNGF